jgi:hypothetical protein
MILKQGEMFAITIKPSMNRKFDDNPCTHLLNKVFDEYIDLCTECQKGYLNQLIEQLKTIHEISKIRYDEHKLLHYVEFRLICNKNINSIQTLCTLLDLNRSEFKVKKVNKKPFIEPEESLF